MTTKNLPTIGRVLLVFASAALLGELAWVGARPGDVVASWDGSASCNVNVKLDGANDKAVLAHFRAIDSGNTLTSVPVYDPLTDEQRAEVAQTQRYWCEWMPYQAGQAGKTNENAAKFEAALTALSDRFAALAAEIEAVKAVKGTGAGVELARAVGHAHEAIAHLAQHLSNDGSDIAGCIGNLLAGKPADHVDSPVKPSVKHIGETVAT